MSPILVRPVREQLEHDRVIRLLQAKYKRKFEVAINPGNEQNAPVGDAPAPWFPDLVLQSQERNRKLLGTVEVETTESINHLEAMSQWVTFSRFKAAFHLYVPSGSIDSTRRLCTDLNVNVAELWAYQTVGDQIRFALVQRSAAAEQKEQKEKRAAAEPVEKPVKTAVRPPAVRNGEASPSKATRVAEPRPARRAPAAPAARRKPTAKVAKSAPPPAARPRRNGGEAAPGVRRAAATAKAPARKGTSRAQKRR